MGDTTWGISLPLNKGPIMFFNEILIYYNTTLGQSNSFEKNAFAKWPWDTTLSNYSYSN